MEVAFCFYKLIIFGMLGLKKPISYSGLFLAMLSAILSKSVLSFVNIYVCHETIPDKKKKKI